MSYSDLWVARARVVITLAAVLGLSGADTFLVFLIPLIAAGILTLAGPRAYPRDVATADASARAINGAADRGDAGTDENAA